MIYEKQPTAFTLEHTALPHAVYLPKGYEEDPHKRWPLVIFLHGAGWRKKTIDQFPNNPSVQNIQKRQDAREKGEEARSFTRLTCGRGWRVIQ